MLDIFDPMSIQLIYHYTSIDFAKRIVTDPIHITQYEGGVAVIAVTMFNNGVKYSLPNLDDTDEESSGNGLEAYDATVIWKNKKQQTGHCEIIGVNKEKDTIYFFVDRSMTTEFGEMHITVRFSLFGQNSRVINTPPIPVIVDITPFDYSQGEER